VFRERWERTREKCLQDNLIAYNREDCLALKAVCDFIDAVPTLASAGARIPGRPEEIASTDSLRKPGDGKRPRYGKAKFVLPEFDLANRCAYFEYQRERVHARPGKKRRSKPGPRRRQAAWRNAEARDIVVRCDRCALCGSSHLEPKRVHRRHLIDLKYFKTGIGVKKWQPRYQIHEYRCLHCGRDVVPPGIAFNAKSRTIYGHGLMCWCIYHNIIGKQSLLQVERSLRDIFRLELPYRSIQPFRSAVASYYRGLYEQILDAILSAEVINIDETPVKLRKTAGYVWILATADKAYYMFKDSREGQFLKDLLSDFSGVLVSDFFTAYDSIGCRHQKCLIHLLRDINDDLRKHPFDSELRAVAEPFGHFLADAVSSIDRWGLSKYHLNKHVKQAKRLLAKLSEKQFVSEPALKYQKRFEKYGPSLFTFLSQDGVPWNNNNAEHAVHYFAKLRRLTDGTFTEKSIGELLTLVSVLQTCEYSGVNPLRFLLSGENALRELSEMAGTRCPKGP
jgi:hypothetical protein